MPASPNLLTVPALVDVTWLEVVGLPAVVVLGIEESLLQTMALMVRPLGFFLLFCTMSPCWFKNHILNWYRSILPTAWYQKLLLPQLLKITARWQRQETPVHVWQWAVIIRKELATLHGCRIFLGQCGCFTHPPPPHTSVASTPSAAPSHALSSPMASTDGAHSILFPILVSCLVFDHLNKSEWASRALLH